MDFLVDLDKKKGLQPPNQKQLQTPKKFYIYGSRINGCMQVLFSEERTNMNHIELHHYYPTLSSKDIDIYYVISDLISISNTDYTEATPKELEQLTGTTERTIRKNIHALISADLICVKRHGYRRRISLSKDRPP